MKAKIKAFCKDHKSDFRKYNIQVVSGNEGNNARAEPFIKEIFGEDVLPNSVYKIKQPQDGTTVARSSMTDLDTTPPSFRISGNLVTIWITN